MKELQVTYKWDNGQEGTFVYPNFPEALDIARKCLIGIEDADYREMQAQALATNPFFASQYWGWFRQILVTWRADAKRHRIGNKSVSPKNAEETARIMAAETLPKYAEPSEQKDLVSKIAEILTPAQIAELMQKLGITEVK